MTQNIFSDEILKHIFQRGTDYTGLNLLMMSKNGAVFSLTSSQSQSIFHTTSMQKMKR